MINEYINNQIKATKIENYPYTHMVIDNFLPPNFAENLHLELMQIEESENPDNNFVSDYGKKKEYKRSIDYAHSYNQLMKILSGNELANCISEKLNLATLYPDPYFDGGGYTVSPKNSFLRYHTDFNFSSKTNKYRIVNLILYMNREYQKGNGGCLHLLDYESKTVEREIEPIFNRGFIFLTNEKTIHGVNRNNEEFQRRSFNTYFYSDLPLLESETIPHKTIWL
jgi:Rps23 Pro-64 3,4-dihydroxylase Tpa1-like proline 4-hydroxylase